MLISGNSLLMQMLNICLMKHITMNQWKKEVIWLANFETTWNTMDHSMKWNFLLSAKKNSPRQSFVCENENREFIETIS